jgi:putative membrane protein
MRSKDCSALSDASTIFASVSPNTLQVNNIKSAILAICAISAGAVAFLLWLIYARQAPVEFASRLTFLPALNALLNGLSATAILSGLFFISRRRIAAHRNAMLVAFCFSSLFLVSYITNHALHGETRYPVDVAHRSLYLVILSSHVSLSILALPLVLVTFLLSLTGRFAMHKRIARFTFPIWLYVSVTGVVVFLMLHKALRSAGG